VPRNLSSYPQCPTALPPARRVRVAVGGLLAGCLALALGACGGSSDAGAGTGTVGGNSNAHSDFLAFSQCMRSHGVTNFPDPSSGGGIQIKAGSGIDPFSPAFKAAQSQCRKLLPGGGPPQGKASAAALAATLKVSQCMRAHGVTGFPDPTTKLPANPQPNQYSIIEDRGGVVLALPASIDPSSPTFQRASQACGFGGGPGKRQPAPAG
jgi:hypothetical protein